MSTTLYDNKIILAPMVRIGTLPMRLLALRYGADLVYTEELIDWKLLRSERRQNDVLGTIDYIDRTDGTVVFRTCPEEEGKVILQIGTCDPERAYQVARLIESDVAGIDINMGCPKEFSIKGGMGAALLSQPEKATAILTKLVNGIKRPISCKIRLLEDECETIALCKRLADCGISAIAIHGRTKSERPQHKNRNSTIKNIANALDIPVIANGGSKEIDNYEDILKFKNETGCNSVMIARAAEWNASVFRKEGKLPLDDVIKAYIRLAIDYDNSPSNTKYCIQNILRELQDTEKGKEFLESQTLLQMSELWDQQDYYKQIKKKHETLGLIGRRDVCPVGYKKNCDGSDYIEMECAFLRNLYPKDPDLPKSQLLSWTKSKGYRLPSYDTCQMDKLFKSIVTVNGKKYTSSFWEKNKRWAEQSAAIVCLCSNGILEKQTLKDNGVLR
ncbi:hypothetical protein O3M35_005078 [Rhynocoris fuscipes]|uniref:Uncharacterized protein n=1 Tax=Rhynocoris fuscipes TaxID=488301 RepID=A0AAW1DPI1_9HEMI